MSSVWSSDGAPWVLSEECDAEHRLVATVAPCHSRGVGRFLMVAAARGGRLLVTPRSAKQRGVRPNCQRQHDRKDKCSKHVMLATVKGKKDANQHKRRHAKDERFTHLQTTAEPHLRDFATAMPKIPQRLFKPTPAYGTVCSCGDHASNALPALSEWHQIVGGQTWRRACSHRAVDDGHLGRFVEGRDRMAHGRISAPPESTPLPEARPMEVP
jgi:hypothetical protein